jgi:hypothetical protein
LKIYLAVERVFAATETKALKRRVDAVLAMVG